MDFKWKVIRRKKIQPTLISYKKYLFTYSISHTAVLLITLILSFYISNLYLLTLLVGILLYCIDFSFPNKNPHSRSFGLYSGTKYKFLNKTVNIFNAFISYKNSYFRWLYAVIYLLLSRRNTYLNLSASSKACLAMKGNKICDPT